MNSILSPDNWPFSLDLLPEPVHLVGGAVRDALLLRRSAYLDLDFVLPGQAVKVARKIASKYKAGFVLLDAEREIARVVFPQATVDFAQQEGDLITDLQRRDFTINAIAYNPFTQEVIDPLEGVVDLERRLLRMVSRSNLADDPLRLMRAYRQAAQLDFTIESATQLAIKSLAPSLSQVAAERVRVELNYLLSSPQGTPWLIGAGESGLLTTFFRNATNESFTQLTAVDVAAVKLVEIWQSLGIEFAQWVRDTVKTSWLTVAKLACLVSPQPEVAEVELVRLTYSRAEIKGVTTALKLLGQLQDTQMSLRQQYFFFRDAGVAFPAIAILAVARGNLIEAIAPLINRYLNLEDPIAHPKLLVTGKDIMEALQIPASPQVGKLITDIALAQIEGQVSTTVEALQLAAKLLER
ncbi:MAG: CCA tRNA nucleotidyltransferase [Nostocaceae cyanobacterium]|nr:CCA tRNA nucleotidyltransferase [Nostocaceae cyanobacterium]